MSESPKSETISIVSIDPGLQVTGYCLLVYDVNNKSIKLVKIGRIKSDVEQPLEERVRFVTDKLAPILQQARGLGKLMVTLEVPSPTIYGQSMSKNCIIGRASDVMRLFFLCGGLVVYCQSNKVYCQIVAPSQWQLSPKSMSDILVLARIAKKNKGQAAETKKWSVKMATVFYCQCTGEQEDVAKKLDVLRDHNVCDAINIGRKTCEFLGDGTWQMPM